MDDKNRILRVALPTLIVNEDYLNQPVACAAALNNVLVSLVLSDNGFPTDHFDLGHRATVLCGVLSVPVIPPKSEIIRHQIII
jgi:hypothetical protein